MDKVPYQSSNMIDNEKSILENKSLSYDLLSDTSNNNNIDSFSKTPYKCTNGKNDPENVPFPLENKIDPQRNPIQEIYQEFGKKLFEENESQPVQVVWENTDYILQTLRNRMFVGEYLADIYRLKNDDSFILISNHIHSVQMTGFVTKYAKLGDIPNKAINYLSPGYGLANSLAVRESHNLSARIFAGFDSGYIIMFDDRLSVLATKQFCHNLITKIRLSPKQDRFICCDYDGRMVYIDCEEMEPVIYYDYAHYDSITDVVFSNEHDYLIITASSDGDILLWDYRVSRSDRPSLVLTSVSTKPTALDWSTEYEIAFGTEAGNVVRFDIRNRQLIHKHMFFKDSMESEHDCSILQLRPLKQGKYLAILASNHHWIFDRKINKPLHHKVYPENIKIRSCIGGKNEEDFLTIGSKFNISYYKNILL